MAEIFAKGSGAEVDGLANTAIGTWNHVSVSGVSVTNGTCQIGARTTAAAGQWLDVDDLTFTKD